MSINPYNLNIAIALTANSLASQFSDGELTLLSSVLMNLADALAVIAAVRAEQETDPRAAQASDSAAQDVATQAPETSAADNAPKQPAQENISREGG